MLLLIIQRMGKLANTIVSLMSALLIACSPKQALPPSYSSSPPAVVETVYTIPTQPPTNYGHWDGKTKESCITTGGTWQHYFGILPDGTFGRIGPQCSYGSMLGSYEIKKGDTIYGIGITMGVQPEDIQEFIETVLKLNPGLVPERMIPGDYIAVPPLGVFNAYLKKISP
jgi:hypothetical protein